MAKNNHGGLRTNSGRKTKTEERELPILIDAVISPEQWKALLKNAYTKAKAGDLGYTKLLMEYRFGKPTDNIDVNNSGELVIKVVRDRTNSTVKDTPS